MVFEDQCNSICMKTNTETISLFFRQVLRNEFDFWNVHGIMNTSGHLRSQREALHGIVNTSGLLQSK